MKKLIYLFILIIPFVSCVSKKSADNLHSQNDSLHMLVAQKDSIINDVFVAMNDISENLNSIKARENILTANIGTGEIKNQTSAQISQDIEAINQLLLQNRETIARLRNSADQLRKANINNEGLEKLITQLNIQMQTKDEEIVVLKKNLQNMNIQVAELSEEVTGLNTKVTDLSQEKSSLEGEVRTATNRLNTGYYIIGSEKELLAKEIIYKSGFIGRTLKINENRSLDSFTQIDVRELEEVIIGHKKATLVSSHPAGSYIFEMDSNGIFQSLIITDKVAFWEYSKVLVVSYK